MRNTVEANDIASYRQLYCQDKNPSQNEGQDTIGVGDLGLMLPAMSSITILGAFK